MQTDLFTESENAVAISGLRYQPAFLTSEEEAHLLEAIRTLPLQAAQYKAYEARRRVCNFGGSYDFNTNTLLPSQALDERLLPLRDRVAKWLRVEPGALEQMLIAEYSPGTPLGWHRDVPNFETIAGVSLGNAAVLRFRPYPPDTVSKGHTVQLEVEPRSIYVMAGKSRWDWQHCVPPVKAPRWSITLRTRRLAHLCRNGDGRTRSGLAG